MTLTDIKGLAFFDLDGTLLDQHSKITPEVAQAMTQLKENNIVPIIATGRTNLEIKEISAAAGIDSFITMNGQYVLFEGKEVVNTIIPKETCRRLAEKTAELNQEIGFYTPDSIRVSGHSENTKEAYSFIHSNLPDIDPAYYETRDLNMLLILGQTDDEKYHAEFDDLTFYRNGPYSIDVVSKGGSKGTGIKALIKELDLEGVPTYGFGDGPNDIDLLKACDNKIAMGNAIPDLKDLATYVTAKNTEGGIVQALKHFNLI